MSYSDPTWCPNCHMMWERCVCAQRLDAWMRACARLLRSLKLAEQNGWRK